MKMQTPSANSFRLWLKDTWTGLQDIVYPPKCSVCKSIGPAIICGRCKAAFGGLEEQLCSRCGGVMRNRTCRNCTQGTPRYIKRARSAGKFEGALREAILQLKYKGKRKLAEPLCGFLEEFLLDKPFGKASFDVVVPVPLHFSRFREREFNQAELLAKATSEFLGLPLEKNVIVRTRKTKPQADLHANERARNVHGAFTVPDGLPIAGKNILLVDDVVTTCATTDECAKVLLESGAKAVYVISLARDV
jgi:competence protein ComFC